MRGNQKPANAKAVKGNSSPPLRTNSFANTNATKTTMGCGSHCFAAVFVDYRGEVRRYFGFESANHVRKWYKIYGRMVNKLLIGIEEGQVTWEDRHANNFYTVIDFTFTKAGRKFANSLNRSLFP